MTSPRRSFWPETPSLGAGGATAAVEYGADISGYVREVARAVTHHSSRPGGGSAAGSGGNDAVSQPLLTPTPIETLPPFRVLLPAKSTA